MKDIKRIIKKYNKTKAKGLYDEVILFMRQETLWLAFFPPTQNYYVEMIDGKAVAFVFSKREYCIKFCNNISIQLPALQDKDNTSKDRDSLFGDLYRSGFEVVVIDSGQMSLIMPLSDIAEEPDFSGIPEINVPVMNPLFLRRANRFFQELSRKKATREQQTNIFRQIYQGRFLLPIDASEINSENSEEANTVVVQKGSKISIPHLTNAENQSFVPIFTDWIELRKYDKENKFSGMIVGFNDMKSFSRTANGIAINPFGVNIPINSQMLADIETAGEGEAPSAPEVQPYELKKDTQVLLGEPKEYPQQMVDAITAFLQEQKNVRQAFLQLMIKDEEQSYLVVVDFNGKRDALFQGIAGIAIPYLHDMYIDLVPYEGFGIDAVKGKEPFYKKA